MSALRAVTAGRQAHPQTAPSSNQILTWTDGLTVTAFRALTPRLQLCLERRAQPDLRSERQLKKADCWSAELLESRILRLGCICEDSQALNQRFTTLGNSCLLCKEAFSN